MAESATYRIYGAEEYRPGMDLPGLQENNDMDLSGDMDMGGGQSERTSAASVFSDFSSPRYLSTARSAPERGQHRNADTEDADTNASAVSAGEGIAYAFCRVID